MLENVAAISSKYDLSYYNQETILGGWKGFLSYTLQGKAFDIKHFWKDGHGKNINTINLHHDRSIRPEYPEYLENYFDKNLNKLLIWNGENWVDAMGNIIP